MVLFTASRGNNFVGGTYAPLSAHLVVSLKSHSNVLFLFQLTNDLCISLTKIVIILFLNKAVLAALFYSPVDCTDASDMHHSNASLMHR